MVQPHACAGCEDPPSTPAEGDVRLVPLNGTAVPTAVCDDVHFGGVELFREGTWGRICPGRTGGEEASFTLDAQVVCRQLGLPFGTVMDAADDEGRGDYSDPLATVWATQVPTWLLHCRNEYARWLRQCTQALRNCSPEPHVRACFYHPCVVHV